MMSAISSTHDLVPLVQSLQFKNGSLSISKPSNNPEPLVEGHGVFEWPSGLKYTGEYVERKRHGYGIQLWPDGAKYEGHFYEDQRHGKGKHSWENGEEYEGEYQRDKKHGVGVYRWLSGAYVLGQFNQDCKEGICVYISADGEKFEGMYHGDERDGEGVLTYPGGRQDVGTWKGTKLVKLRFTVKEAYFDPASCDHPLKSPGSSLGSPDLKERGKKFGPKGPLEVMSEELIQAASDGEIAKVTNILRMGAVHVDVADRNGHTALFAASTHSHPEVVNVLLDNGADVNRLDCVGVTALNACHHVLYSPLPQMKDLLKCLPRLEYPQSQPSPPRSTTLTDCTLHTSDFVSTPRSDTSCPHSSSSACSECEGLCEKHKTTPNREDGARILPSFRSRPSVPFLKETTPASLCSASGISSNSVSGTEVRTAKPSSPLMAVTQRLALTSAPRPTISVSPGTRGSEGNSPQCLDNVSTAPRPTISVSPGTRGSEGNSPQCLDKVSTAPRPTISVSPGTRGSEGNSPQCLDNVSTALSSAVDETSLYNVVGNSPTGRSDTASANGNIRVVSTISPDSHLSTDPRFPEDGISIASLPQQEYSSSEEMSGVSIMEAQKEIVLNLTRYSKSSEPSASALLANASEPLLPSQCANSPLSSSSVFSSTQYGPIMSAAQSTTLSCSSVSRDESSTHFANSELSELEQRCSSAPDATIALLLKRGANPNQSSLPLSPLIYGMRSGDTQSVQRLAERGADINHPLPKELGGHLPLVEAIRLVGPNSIPMIESLLKYKAHVNVPSPHSVSSGEGEEGPAKDCSPEEGKTEGVVLAGENGGDSHYAPLHWACAHREHPSMSQEELAGKVLTMVALLLESGASVDVVARGHSPLSLAITNGYDRVAEKLLAHGADPNLPLGPGVGTALCSLITHSALKKRNATNSLKLVDQLLAHGADIVQPVSVTGNSPPGTVADFAHAAFKEDRRLSCLKYSALSKSERTRYLAWKKLLNNFVNLFKCKALHTIALRENVWLQVQVDRQVDSKLLAQRERLLRTSSVVQTKLPVSHRRSRTISAGGVPSRTRSRADILPSFPLVTLKTAMRKVACHHGPTLNGDLSDRPDRETVSPSNEKVQENRLLQLKELFGSAVTMFSCVDSGAGQTDDQERNGLSMTDSTGQPVQSSTHHALPQWTLSCFCYECGRSSPARLFRCPGCLYVHYCGQTCRVESYKKGHKEECSGGFVKQQAPSYSKPSKSRQIRSAALH